MVLKLGQYKTYYQIGIVSFGFEGICGNGRPAIYTRLASYLEWIEASLEPWLMQMATSFTSRWFSQCYCQNNFFQIPICYRGVFRILILWVLFKDFYLAPAIFSYSTKGKLISKCPFGFIVWTKIPTIFFPEFLP